MEYPQEPQRRCVSCRQLQPRPRLIQVVYSRLNDQFSLKTSQASTPETLETSASSALQGRSAYVCETPACLADALKAKKLQRSLKSAIPGDILISLNKRLEGLNNSVST